MYNVKYYEKDYLSRVESLQKKFANEVIDLIKIELNKLKDDYIIYTGMGYTGASKNGKTIYSYELEDKLPKRLWKLVDVLISHEFIDSYYSEIKLK